jgi:hypothetical protein
VKDIGSNYQSAHVVLFTYCVWEGHDLSDLDEHEWARGPTCCGGGLRNCEASTKIRGGFVGTHLHFCECFEKLEGSASCVCGLRSVLVQTVSALTNIYVPAESS